MDRTYQELTVNDRRFLDLNINRRNGEAFPPSGAFYSVVGHEKQNPVQARAVASINYNKVTGLITETVTASAGDYDILWEIRKDGASYYHCTSLLVTEC